MAQDLPVMLEEFQMVDLRGDGSDALEQLIWGITGEQPPFRQ